MLSGGALTCLIICFRPYLPPPYSSSDHTALRIALELSILYVLLIHIYFLRYRIAYPYEKLEDVLNHLPLAVLTYDQNRRLSFANRMAEEITGLSYSDLKVYSRRKSANSILNGLVTEEINWELAQNNMVQQKILTIKNQIGEPVKIVADAFKLQSGDLLFMFDTADKVQELQNLRLQTQTIINSLRNFVIITDVKPSVIMCNKAFCEAVEMDTSEIIGTSIHDLVSRVSFRCSDLQDDNFDSSVLENPLEGSITTPSGESKDLLFQFAHINNFSSELIGGIIVGSDISSMKKEQAEAQKKERNVLLGQMATGIVHEIRNPITAMLGFIHIMNSKLQDDKLREYCICIEKEALELNRIVSAFLQFARPRPSVFRRISVDSLVDSLRLAIDTNLTAKGIKVQYDLRSNLPLIHGDENKIRQALLNIVKNSEEALINVDDPRIIISTGSDSEAHEVYISITDNGPAISPELLKKIGTPFFTTKAKGTGLGLSICRQIISEHKGRIKITSKAAVGTTVKISFPRPVNSTLVKPVSKLS